MSLCWGIMSFLRSWSPACAWTPKAFPSLPVKLCLSNPPQTERSWHLVGNPGCCAQILTQVFSLTSLSSTRRISERCSAPFVSLLDCKLSSDVYHWHFQTEPAVFHTTSSPDGVCLNKTSRLAASLLDKDGFGFSLLSLWSSSVGEEKAWKWHLSPFYKTVKRGQNIYQELNFSTKHNSLRLLFTLLPMLWCLLTSDSLSYFSREWICVGHPLVNDLKSVQREEKARSALPFFFPSLVMQSSVFGLPVLGRQRCWSSSSAVW